MAIRGAGEPRRRVLWPTRLLAKKGEQVNYLRTLCSPSVTLQPFEYCLPFDSVFDDVEEDETADLENWHDFVKETCGVSLTVYTACLPGAAVSKS